MLMIPASRPSRSTGMWRTRWCVIRFITRLTLSSGDTVVTPYRMMSFYRHRPDRLAVASKCVNDFTFGDETKNCVPTRHHESADILCAQPVRRTLDAGSRTYCCNVGALAPQDAFDGHRLLPSCAPSQTAARYWSEAFTVNGPRWALVIFGFSGLQMT
jgi:hypothetical protein